MAVPVSSRFQVVDTPVLAPGYCFVCRANNNGPFIDTGLSHTWFTTPADTTRDGAVYLCSACINEMAANLAISGIDIDAILKVEFDKGVTAGIKHSKKDLDDYLDSFEDKLLETSVVTTDTAKKTKATKAINAIKAAGTAKVVEPVAKVPDKKESLNELTDPALDTLPDVDAITDPMFDIPAPSSAKSK